jgi:hypothetical protein
MAQLTIMNRFSQMMNFALPAAPLIERISLKKNQHLTLSRKANFVRVLSGSAWISYLGKDIVLKQHDMLELKPGRDIAIVTPLGQKSVELEVIQ